MPRTRPSRQGVIGLGDGGWRQAGARSGVATGDDSREGGGAYVRTVETGRGFLLPTDAASARRSGKRTWVRKRSVPRLWLAVRARSNPLERVRLVVVEDRVERRHARGRRSREGRERRGGDGGRERRARAHLRVRARPLFEVVLEPVRVQVRLRGHGGKGRTSVRCVRVAAGAWHEPLCSPDAVPRGETVRGRSRFAG